MNCFEITRTARLEAPPFYSLRSDPIDYDSLLSRPLERPKTEVIYQGPYSLNDIKKCRESLINDYYSEKEEYESLFEITLKRKLGIFTRDVVQFYMEGIPPKKVRNPIINEILYDSTGQVVSSKCRVNQTYEPEVQQAPTVPLNTDKTHCCQDSLLFCPKDVQLYSDESDSDPVYICDSCKFNTGLEDIMLEHLNDSQHFSASLYHVNDKSTPPVYYLKTRAQLQNPNQNLDFLVLCPQCYFVSSSNIIASCLHYKYVHRQHNNNELIYSVTDSSISQRTFELTKAHKCSSCDQRFKKLSDLSLHLETSKHFPFPQNETVINVYYCPLLEKCLFRACDYSVFKIHVLNHPNLSKVLDDDPEAKIPVVVKTFNKPKTYFHVRSFGGRFYNDQLNELEGIDSLLDSLKGYPDQNEIVKKLKARKDEIHKSLPLSKR